MGQASSKRRSYTPGVDKSSEIATSPRANGDVKANGSIEVHEEHDVSGSNALTSPTSPTSVTSSSSSGKKEKRKRFRVGFSLRRTPSGRWTRKKRSNAQNGTRPVSCPLPVTEESEANTGRPQSLFLDELEIQEEETKHETVDLSDHEDGKTKSKSAPKPPEKTKGKRGSKKNSSGKKKKKEKSSSKKDKKKKQKAAEETEADKRKASSSSEKVTTPTSEAVAVTVIEAAKTEASLSAPTVEGELPRDVEKETAVTLPDESELHAVASSIVAETVNIAQERLRAESEQPTEISAPDAGAAQSTELSSVEATLPEVVIPTSEAPKTEDVATTTAASDQPPQVEIVEEIIVAKTEGTESAAVVAEDIIAQVTDKPLQAPSNEIVDSFQEIQLGQVDIPDLYAVVNKTEESVTSDPAQTELSLTGDHVHDGETTAKEESVTIAAASGQREDSDNTGEEKSAMADSNENDESIKVNTTVESAAESNDSSISLAAEEAVAMAEQAEAEVNQLVATSASVQHHPAPPPTDQNITISAPTLPVTADTPLELTPDFSLQTESDPKVSISHEESIQVKSEISTEIVKDEIAKEASVHYEDISEKVAAELESEAIAKDTVEEMVTTAMGVVEGDKCSKDYEDVERKSKSEDEKPEAEKSGSDSENEKMKRAELEKEKRETERIEKERQKKLKEEERAKEKERIKEEKRRKAEQKAAEKAEKEKSRSEKKIKVPKRLSNFFHRKDKSPKTVGEIEVEGTEKGETSLSDSSPPESPSSPSQSQEVETMVCPTEQAPTESPPCTSSAPANASLTVDVSVEPLGATAPSAPDSSPEFADTESPPCLESPDGTTSDSGEPVSPASDSEKGGTSGSLKKITLGPRLRTAILRKKSSGASDSGHEDKKLSLTQPKAVESAEISPPPRKLRPRKPVEQYSPITPGAHNLSSLTDSTNQQSSVSNDDSALDTSIQSETALTAEVEDSGVADLTSPEGEHSDTTPVKDSESKTVVEEAIEAAHSVSVSCAPVAQIPLEITSTIKDNSETITEESASRLLHLDLNKSGISATEAEVSQEENKDNTCVIPSPLSSPTVVSTASIVLRSPSTEDTPIDANSVNTLDESSPANEAKEEQAATTSDSLASTVCDIKDNIENDVVTKLETSADLLSSSPAISAEENEKESSETNTEIGSVQATLADDGSGDEEFQLQAQQYTVVCAAQTASDLSQENTTAVVAEELAGELAEERLPTSNGHSREDEQPTGPRTIAEYQIGEMPDLEEEDKPRVRTVREYVIGVDSESETAVASEEVKLESSEISVTCSSSTTTTNGESKDNGHVDVGAGDTTLTPEEADVTSSDDKIEEEIDNDKTLVDEPGGANGSGDGADILVTVCHQNGVKHEGDAEIDVIKTAMTEIQAEGEKVVTAVVVDVAGSAQDQEQQQEKEGDKQADDEEDDTKPMGTEKSTDAILMDNNSNNNQETSGEACSKVGPTATIEAYLKLQYADNSTVHNGGQPSVVNGSKGLINWTATYRHDSTIVAPYEKFVPYNASVLIKPQTRNFAEGKTKKVAWFVSNCGARNGRRQYADELAKHIQVDIYGNCGLLRCPRYQASKCFDMLNKDYKFYLSFENSNCRDYITEKFFVNGLKHDVIPIVMGAAPEDYKRAAPPHSYIHVDDFESPQALAEYLLKLDQDDKLYNEYFQWKGTGDIINTYFWCRVCALANDEDRGSMWYRDLEAWWRGEDVCIGQDTWRTKTRKRTLIADLPQHIVQHIVPYH